MKGSIVRELRVVERFAITLPVQLSWRAAGRPDQTVRGRTRDISTRGMFVLAPTGPREGERLKFEIDMALDEFSPLLRVQGEGRAVRVERPASASRLTGFAVHNLWFKLREPEKGEALLFGTKAQTGPAARSVPRIEERNSPRRLTIARPKTKTFPD